MVYSSSLKDILLYDWTDDSFFASVQIQYADIAKLFQEFAFIFSQTYMGSQTSQIVGET